MHPRIVKELGFRLEMDEHLTWWIHWPDEAVALATEREVRLWEELEAEVRATARRKTFRAAPGGPGSFPASSSGAW